MRKTSFVPIGMLLLLCLLPAFEATAQRLAVRGTVTSSINGEPVKGVKVTLNTSTETAQTGKDGSYIINVDQNFFNPTPTPTLTFAHPDYEEQSIAVIGRKRVDVLLRSTDVKGTESFATNLALPRTVTTLPFAATLLDEATVQQNRPNRLSTALAGRVPGLRLLQAGGQAGQAFDLQLRGINHLSGTQQPLLLVDGIFMADGNLLDINPEDVAKVEVLKGAAGAAAFGAQGANGVIQVFTKDGYELADGQTQVTYRTDYQVSDVQENYPVLTFTNREILDPSGPQPLLGPATSANTYTNPLPNLQDYEGAYLFERRSLRSNSLTVTGRTGGTHFRGSAQRFRDEGVIPGRDGYTRHAFRANLGHQAGDRLKVRGSAYYVSSQNDANAAQGAIPGNPVANTLLLTPMFDLDARNEEDGTSLDWDIDNTGARITNPLYLRQQLQQEMRHSRLMGTFGGTFEAAKWLFLDYAATLDRSTTRQQRFIDKGYLSTNVPAGFGPLTTAGVQGSNGGGLENAQQDQQYFTSTLSLLLHKDWMGFNTAFRAGLLYEDLDRSFELMRGENLAVAGNRSLDNPQSETNISSLAEEMNSYSGFVQADVDFRDRYIFSAAARAEQSTLFGASVDWPAFYRLGAAYRLSEDVNLKIFQELKFRAAMGTAGIRPAYQQRFETYELVNGSLSRQTIANDALQPARTQELEVGIDMTVFKAFTLSGTYVQSTTEDQILFQQLSGGAGFEGQWRNAGTVEADIYEGSLQIDFKKLFRIPGRKVRWDIQATGQRIEQRVAALAIPAYETGPGWANTDLFRIEEGQPLGIMVGQAFAQTPDDLSGNPDFNPFEYTTNERGFIVQQDLLGTPGEVPVLITDENGAPVQQVIGDINPDFQLGIAHTFAYGGFELFALFDWRKGGDIYNYTKQWMYANERHADLGASPELPATFYGPQGLSGNLTPNAYFVEDGSYFMLREAAISYTFTPERLPALRNIFEEIRFSLIGRNLFTLTDYSGYHPALTTATGGNPLRQRQDGTPGSSAASPGGNPALFAVDFFNHPLRRHLGFSAQITF
ncbi:MAG: SusC/RagA family TonB-linked outer membrane protein [Phaeodactylibacter sp.]|uniref:SusC/RagA family TonB-linked outer membrane protein n=1 Tax=Phaeodactylibacter sp. TaxID=1940289 RepID=UPI0032EC754A